MTDILSLPTMSTSQDDLLTAALRHANDVSHLLNEISTELFRLDESEGGDNPKFNRLHDLVRRRLLEQSGVFLFIAADNLRIDLPPDLRFAPSDEPE